MPTMPHEAPLYLFRACPELVPELLAAALHVAVPPHSEVRIDESNFVQVVPAEYRADLVLTLFDANARAPVMSIVVEVQLARDSRKRFTWPLYVAALHAKLECPTCLVVIATDDDVARWAAEPIGTLQPGSAFTPLVLGRARIPVVTSAEEASRAPELAVLSALAHGRGAPDVAIAIGRAAIHAARTLDREPFDLYTDLVLFAVGNAARAALEIEMNLTDYEYKSETFKKKIAEAAAAGEARGEARAVLTVLAARGIVVADDVRARVLACTDKATLERWLQRAVTSATVEEVARED